MKLGTTRVAASLTGVEATLLRDWVANGYIQNHASTEGRNTTGRGGRATTLMDLAEVREVVKRMRAAGYGRPKGRGTAGERLYGRTKP